jgi:hypothetical protein
VILDTWTESYPDSSTSSPVENQSTILRSINLSADDSDDGFADSPGRSEEVHLFRAYFQQIMEPPDEDNEDHDDGPDCRRVGEEFRGFLMALNEPGAALAFNVEVIEQNIAKIYAFEPKQDLSQIFRSPSLLLFTCSTLTLISSYPCLLIDQKNSWLWGLIRSRLKPG